MIHRKLIYHSPAPNKPTAEEEQRHHIRRRPAHISNGKDCLRASPDFPTLTMIFKHNYPWQLMHRTKWVQWVIEQEFISQCKPITFFLTKLFPAQRKYSIYPWELQAIYLVIKHFWHFLEGRNFTIYTNHKPLTTTISTSSDKYTSHKIWNLNCHSFQLTSGMWRERTMQSQMLPWIGIHSLKASVLSQDLIPNRKPTQHYKMCLWTLPWSFKSAQYTSAMTLCTTMSA